MISISKITQRRYVLGKQGLWPGRRWAGKEGTAEAVRAIEAVQMDPLNVVARSHDIVLWGRVLEYRPEYLDQLLYQDRRFFDYGGGLFIYPMEELPYWRTHMARRGESGRWMRFIADHPELIQTVREEIRQRGPLGNRDLEGNRVVGNYRGRKETSLAMYALWITGELLIHHRQGFERFYDLRERILPPDLNSVADEEQVEAFFSRKTFAFLSLVRERGWKNSMADYLQRPVSLPEAHRYLERSVQEGTIVPIQVEGSKEIWYALSEDLSLLADLESGEIPLAWQPLDTTTRQEVVFLAPLDIVSARGRAAWLFDFEYLWEVYKPAEKRRWGYYTLPILYDDRLVGRLDPRMDRGTGTLHIQGFWLEEHAPASDPDFAYALAKGLIRFATFVDAKRVEIQKVESHALREKLQELISQHLKIMGRQ